MIYNHFIMEKFKKNVRDLFGIDLNTRQMDAFRHYESELLEWNSRFNLTAIRDAEGVRTKHFLDSLTCLLAWTTPPTSLIDVGTGAGFPGIPIKIILPGLRLTLVESVGKKVTFCQHIVKSLGLERVTVLQARAEELGQQKQHREQYDWAVARAVASLPVLSEYLIPLARVGGGALAQKGETAPAEAQSASRALQILGGQLRHIKPVEIPGIAEDRYLVIIDKIAPTPPGYPRRVGLPSQRPIG